MTTGKELDRLTSGPAPGEQPEGLLAQLVAHCDGDATAVLERAREVLSVVLKQPEPLPLEQWRNKLPDWFVQKCAAEITREEAERRRHLPMDQRASLAQNWSLSAWLYWLRPDERPWRWWNAEVTSPDFLRVCLVVPGLPYPSGAIEWLIRCGGASVVEKVE